MINGAITGPLRHSNPAQTCTITSMNVNGFSTDTAKQRAGIGVGIDDGIDEGIDVGIGIDENTQASIQPSRRLAG